jgi:hypothetical protein
MRPWTIGGKIMGTYHHMAIAPWKLSIMLFFTQNENMNKREDIMGTITIAWWSWLMLPSHQCYRKLDHEHEHDQKKLWALANVWPPHHNDDLMLLSAYTKWEWESQTIIWFLKIQLRLSIKDLHFYKWSWKKDSWIMNHGWWWRVTSGVLCN